MIDRAIEEIMYMFDLCVETLIAIIQASAIGVIGIQEREFYGRRQGRVEGDSLGQLNPNAQRFDPRVGATPVNADRNDRSHSSEAQTLNN
jgi:hypothetical protein